MHRSTRRLIGLAAGLVLFLVVCALLYQLGMARLEGLHRTFWDSFEWAAETLSTTGYGADSHWNHPAMVMLVVVVQFAGVFLVFLVVRFSWCRFWKSDSSAAFRGLRRR